MGGEDALQASLTKQALVKHNGRLRAKLRGGSGKATNGRFPSTIETNEAVSIAKDLSEFTLRSFFVPIPHPQLQTAVYGLVVAREWGAPPSNKAVVR